jgi:hypothetical protein
MMSEYGVGGSRQWRKLAQNGIVRMKALTRNRKAILWHHLTVSMSLMKAQQQIIAVTGAEAEVKFGRDQITLKIWWSHSYGGYSSSKGQEAPYVNQNSRLINMAMVQLSVAGNYDIL